MRGRWSSYRFRRRLVWSGAAVAAVAGVVATAALIGNTAHPEQDPQQLSSAPATVVRSPKLARLRPAQRAQLLRTSLLFVRTAVAREDLDRAYDLAGPALTEGMSRREWAKGDIPVVPFPAAGLAAWKLAYSYANDVAFNLSLVAARGASPVVGKTFTIELTRRNGRAPWRVASWSPTGISGVGNDPKLAAELQRAPAPSAALPLWWIALPVFLLALAVLLPAGLGARHWWVGRRSDRDYRAERGITR